MVYVVYIGVFIVVSSSDSDLLPFPSTYAIEYIVSNIVEQVQSF